MWEHLDVILTALIAAALGGGSTAALVSTWLSHRRELRRQGDDVARDLLTRLEARVEHVEAAERDCMQSKQQLAVRVGELQAVNESLKSDIAENHDRIAELTGRVRALEGATTGTVVCDSSGIILEWSTGAEVIFGWRSDEILGKNVDTLIPIASRSLHRTAFAKAVERGSTRNVVLSVYGLRKDRTDVLLNVRVESSSEGGNLFFVASIQPGKH